MLQCTTSEPGAFFRSICRTLLSSRIVKSWSDISSDCANAFATVASLIGARMFSSLSTGSDRLLLLFLLANSSSKCSACSCSSGCLRGLESPLGCFEVYARFLHHSHSVLSPWLFLPRLPFSRLIFFYQIGFGSLNGWSGFYPRVCGWV